MVAILLLSNDDGFFKYFCKEFPLRSLAFLTNRTKHTSTLIISTLYYIVITKVS